MTVLQSRQTRHCVLQDHPIEMSQPRVVIRALVIMAAVTTAAAATMQPQASAAKPSTGALRGPPPESGRPQLAAGVPCRVITANPLGVCPPSATVQPPTLALCPKLVPLSVTERMEPRPALCGSGFHPGDLVNVIVVGAYGSTFWPAESDRYGRFRSILPSLLCRLTPATVFALDMHHGGSASIPLGGVRCP